MNMNIINYLLSSIELYIVGWDLQTHSRRVGFAFPPSQTIRICNPEEHKTY